MYLCQTLVGIGSSYILISNKLIKIIQTMIHIKLKHLIFKFIYVLFKCLTITITMIFLLFKC